MKTPLLLLGLLFWGWQTSYLTLAIPMILILAGYPWIRLRGMVSEAEFRKIFKVCGGFLLVMLIKHWITHLSLPTIYGLIKTLPIFIFPLLLAQTYSGNYRINLRRFFTPQNPWKANADPKQYLRDFQYCYIALCILAASTANTKGIGFQVGMFILVVGMLLNLRSTTLRSTTLHPKRTYLLWGCLILLAGSMGAVGHVGLHQLHATLEQQAAPWLSGFDGQSVDPYQATTRIGTLGDLKQSKTIVFRVVTGDRPTLPLLLREATYNKYQTSAWVAVKSQFMPVQPAVEGTTWKLGEDSDNLSTITVSAQLDRGQGLLRLPDGASSVHQLPVEKMLKNQYGAVKVQGKTDAIAYQVQFNPTQSFDSPPSEADLHIPDAEKPVLSQTLQQLHLEGNFPAQTLQQLSSYFEQNFQYSLSLSRTNPTTTPLTEFLTKSHTGHCEYFASATTLLLRAAGIPARYATGYAVNEFSPLERQYIVRSRDAHAWTMVYVNGGWQSFDTTPPNWTAQPNSAPSPLEWISDLWSFLAFQLSATLQSLGKRQPWILGAIVPFLAIALWFFSRRNRRPRKLRRVKPEIAPKAKIPILNPGQDSEFYAIEQALTEIGLNRLPAESLQHWIQRLENHLQPSLFNTLSDIIQLHYRYRFDPHTLDTAERTQLKTLSQTWLQTYLQTSIPKYLQT